MPQKDVKKDESVLEVEELLEMVVEKLNDQFQKMESKDVTNKDTSSDVKAEVLKDDDQKISAKSETTSLKDEPTQKKSFFRFFSLRAKKTKESDVTPIDIPLENTKNISENGKEVQKCDDTQVVNIEQCVTTEIDKVTSFKNICLIQIFLVKTLI